jgi:hypothetical protein
MAAGSICKLPLAKMTGLNKSWVFRFALNGHKRRMGLGSLHTYGLGEARERAC